MAKKRDELPQKKKTEKLKEGYAEQYGVKIEKRRHSWYIAYLCTAVGVVIACVVFLFAGGTDNADINTPSGIERLASAILGNDFMELSGGIRDTSGDNSIDVYDSIFEIINGILIPSEDPDDSNSVIVPEDDTPAPSPESIYTFDPSRVPEGETAIIPMDLSLSEYGAAYIYNSTGLTPNTDKLLSASLSLPSPKPNSSAPLVLIVHTHGTESYSEDGAISYLDDGSELARSENVEKNVVAVGKVLADTLIANGIPTVQCTIMHDKLQYKDSYVRSEETIKEYLEKYPSIKLVIDLHRDSVVKSTGELVRPVALADSEPTAQVMCVVGSSWGGESCPNWENNLALALKLRNALNSKYDNLCRPPYLRPSTYNQELAPYSLLLEIGASGNSLEEAKRAVRLVGKELSALLNAL